MTTENRTHLRLAKPGESIPVQPHEPTQNGPIATIFSVLISTVISGLLLWLPYNFVILTLFPGLPGLSCIDFSLLWAGLNVIVQPFRKQAKSPDVNLHINIIPQQEV